MDEDALRLDLSNLERERPDIYAALMEDPDQGFPPTEDLIATGLFSQLEDGLLYLPQGALDSLRDPL
jgi:hypothetical protein